MRIGIIGSRGIPNNYGGFEQFAESLSVYLADLNHEVFVYNSSYHPYKEKNYKGVTLIHRFDPERQMGTIGQFFYDFNCIIDARKRNFDIILQLGYTSSSIWSFLFPKKAKIITNMDGLEWKRSKYSRFVQKFLKYAEKLAVNNSDHLIADSIGIANYLQKKYKIESRYIAYGTDVFEDPDPSILEQYQLRPYDYNMLIARIEPENNIEMILDGITLSKSKRTFLVIGNHQAKKFGLYLKNKYKTHSNIRFLGPIYNKQNLNNLRYFSSVYFHGHSVGGTNPSLLEAMASNCLIAAHCNEFNRYILEGNAYYFKEKKEVSEIVDSLTLEDEKDKLKKNIEKIHALYNTSHINKSYLTLFNDCLQ